MKLHKKLCILLSAVVLMQLLSGCRNTDPAENSTDPDTSPRPSQGLDISMFITSNPSAEPSAEPTEEPSLWDPGHRLNIEFTPSEELELPVNGATGYASIQLPLWKELPEGEAGKLVTIYAPREPEPTDEPTGEPSPEPSDSDPASEPTSEPSPEPVIPSNPMAGAVLVLEPGTAFLILRESGDWWQVQTQDDVTGWIEHRYCLINLPDVIPSMIYNDTNSYSSVFVSCGKSIPNITGIALYQAKADNPRLGYQEFMMPVLYAMAKNVGQAQQNALAEGNTLVLYEGFRPYTTQIAVARNLIALSQTDPVIKAGISASPWNISWFIATGISNHQEGYAMDVSLAKVTRAHIGTIGEYSVVQVDEYEEYTMPTPIHELSISAATYIQPVAIFSTTAWQSATMTPTMAANEPAKALQRYCTSASLTPLASEWWHFNDLAAYGQAQGHRSTGNYLITSCLSTIPAIYQEPGDEDPQDPEPVESTGGESPAPSASVEPPDTPSAEPTEEPASEPSSEPAPEPTLTPDPMADAA